MTDQAYLVVLEIPATETAEASLEYVAALALPELQAVTQGEQGPPGPPGKDAPGSGGGPIISTDPANRITQGIDGGLHVLDDLVPDPLAYYILARS